LVLNFLLVLNRRWHLQNLVEIAEQYARLDDYRQGKREVHIISAIEPEKIPIDLVTKAVAEWGGFTPIVRITRDESLIGGLVIVVGDERIDASVSGQLKMLRRKVLQRLQSNGKTGAQAVEA